VELNLVSFVYLSITSWDHIDLNGDNVSLDCVLFLVFKSDANMSAFFDVRSL
jgi:hypothetical protein